VLSRTGASVQQFPHAEVMSSLPSLADVQFDHDGRTLWPNILSAEQAALEAAPTKSSAKYNNSLIGIRFLGFLLQDLWQHNQHSFGLTPYQRLIKEIASCLSISGQIPASEEEAEAQHGQLQNLGLFYRNHLIRIFRSNGDPIPQSSDPPSRPSMDVLRDRITKKMKTPTTPRSARQSALMRDGYRCMLTGQYDIHSADVYPELNDRAVADGVSMAVTQCAHIFSETAQDDKRKADLSAFIAIAILRMFGLQHEAENLVGSNVHRHFNILTMRSDLHNLFDRLDFWLEEVAGEASDNQSISIQMTDVSASGRHLQYCFYQRQGIENGPTSSLVRHLPDRSRRGSKLQEESNQSPALPSPSLLAIRAACSRVAHLSGAAEQVDQILRDLEDRPVMAEDGGSAHLLESRLLQLSRAVSIEA
ncbi:unnamed protein product, partial [Mycena citricolor]